MSTKQKDRQRTFPLAIPEQEKAIGYDPLPSVWFGDDSELLDKMLRFYPRKRPKDILDATVNGGAHLAGS